MQGYDAYVLAMGSAAEDAGIDVGLSDDFFADLRPMGTAFDIGAYEFTVAVDIVTDGNIDILDLSKIASQWLQTGCTTGEWCEGTDLDMNGEVNIGDFAVLADHWLLTSN